MFIKAGIVLKKGGACQIEKETAIKSVPAADRGDDDVESTHSLPKANRCKSMNSDNPVPSVPSSGALSLVK
jgi:hypothetical protein